MKHRHVQWIVAKRMIRQTGAGGDARLLCLLGDRGEDLDIVLPVWIVIDAVSGD